MLSMVKMLLKREVGGSALNSHGNYIVDHGIVILNFCGNPDSLPSLLVTFANSLDKDEV